MAHYYHHALSSQKKWGGDVEDYVPIHKFLDSSKEHMTDTRHRALLHHSAGIGICDQVFGPTIKLSNGQQIPTRWVAEMHIIEDLGRIPTLQDWFSGIPLQRWMTKSMKLSEEFLKESESKQDTCPAKTSAQTAEPYSLNLETAGTENVQPAQTLPSEVIHPIRLGA